jgi:hypothetical protein
LDQMQAAVDDVAAAEASSNEPQSPPLMHSNLDTKVVPFRVLSPLFENDTLKTKDDAGAATAAAAAGVSDPPQVQEGNSAVTPKPMVVVMGSRAGQPDFPG